jgi:hypothetical protein
MSLAGRFMSALAALLASTAAHAGCTAIKSASLPIQLWGQKLLVPASINGTSQFLAVDTGAPMLVLTPRAAARAGVTDDGAGGDIALNGTGVNNREWDGRLHRFPSVEFAGDETRFMPAEIINGTSLHQYETLLSGSDGLVGLTVLHKHRLWISYQTKTIFVQPRGPSVGAGD